MSVGVVSIRYEHLATEPLQNIQQPSPGRFSSTKSAPKANFDDMTEPGLNWQRFGRTERGVLNKGVNDGGREGSQEVGIDANFQEQDATGCMASFREINYLVIEG